jgi:hypothetical protein
MKISLRGSINNPDHPELHDKLEWGGSFDPNALDLGEINEALARTRLTPSRRN